MKWARNFALSLLYSGAPPPPGGGKVSHPSELYSTRVHGPKTVAVISLTFEIYTDTDRRIMDFPLFFYF